MTTPDAELREWVETRQGISPDKKKRFLTLLANEGIDSIKLVMISIDQIEATEAFKDFPKKDRDAYKHELRNLTFEWKQGYSQGVAKASGLLNVMQKGLVQAGGLEDRCNVKQETPLIKAVKRGNKEEVTVLLHAGANVLARNKDQWTTLMIAASEGHLDIARLLVEMAGKKLVDETNSYGKTALALARQNGHADIVRYLETK